MFEDHSDEDHTEEEGKEMYEEEQPSDVGRHLTCVIHRLCLTPKHDNIE